MIQEGRRDGPPLADDRRMQARVIQAPRQLRQQSVLLANASHNRVLVIRRREMSTETGNAKIVDPVGLLHRLCQRKNRRGVFNAATMHARIDLNERTNPYACRLEDSLQRG